MHEVSLVSAIVDQVTEASRKQSFNRVKRITLSVGAASGVDPDSIEFCFTEVTKGTVLDGASLIIDEVPLVFECKDCKTQTQSDEILALVCPQCSSLDVKVLNGKDFLIMGLEVI